MFLPGQKQFCFRLTASRKTALFGCCQPQPSTSRSFFPCLFSALLFNTLAIGVQQNQSGSYHLRRLILVWGEHFWETVRCATLNKQQEHVSLEEKKKMSSSNVKVELYLKKNVKLEYPKLCLEDFNTSIKARSLLNIWELLEAERSSLLMEIGCTLCHRTMDERNDFLLSFKKD